MADIQNRQFDGSARRVRAAQYLRMSTENQQYSADNQAATIQEYAEKHGFEIVATYADEGRSGVTAVHRQAMLQLMDDVESPKCNFEAILVFDVSRWGRFQNPDDAAVYEVRCRWAGVPVHYCAELFQNDGSIASSIMKTLKRAMAAEYSRELSAKVSDGHIRMLQRGYHQGGFPCFALQRVLVDSTGNRKQVLRFKERKSIQSDRVILEPGPPEDVAIVDEVYRRYLAGERQNILVTDLNNRGVKTPAGKTWTENSMRRLLTSECYIGNIIWGKSQGKLSRNRIAVPRSEWIKHEGAYRPVVEPELFWKVQVEYKRRKVRYSAEEVLADMRKLLKKHGTLSRDLLNKSHGTASAPTVHRLFGSLTAAYALVGFKVRPTSHCTEIDRRISLLVSKFGLSLSHLLFEQPTLEVDGNICRMTFGGRELVLMLARFIDRKAGIEQWYFPWENAGMPSELVIGLMAKGNAKVRDYFVLRDCELAQFNRIARRDSKWLEPFRQRDLQACAQHLNDR